MNIEIVQTTDSEGNIIESVIIDRGNGEYTSMSKSYWEELQAQKELGGTL
jgi:hypothetical protein